MDSGGRRETASSLLVRALLLSGQGSTRMTSCNPNHLPEASPLNATPLGVIGLQHMNLEDTNIQSVKAAVRSLPAGAGRVPNVRAPPPGAHSTLMAALRWALRSPHFTGEETEARNRIPWPQASPLDVEGVDLKRPIVLSLGAPPGLVRSGCQAGFPYGLVSRFFQGGVPPGGDLFANCLPLTPNWAPIRTCAFL